MLIALIILLGFMISGLPIYLSLLFSGLYLLIVVCNVPATMIVTALFDGSFKFTLTAVPFFILAGSLMMYSSMTRRLIDAITPWFVRLRGGIGIASVFANELFGAMSGSAAAAAGTIGRSMYNSVKETHGEKFSLGLFASCGSLAIIMPPSISMILFACATNASVGSLFLAGIIPAIITGVGLAIYIIIKAKPVPDESKFDLRFALSKFKDGFLVLLLPVLVLGGIYTGIFTPTEAGAISALYCLVIPVFVYREIGWKEVLASLKETVYLTGQLFILVAVSTVFSQALAIAQVPSMLMNALSGLTPFTFFVMMNIILLIVGCFFDSASAVLILAPVIAPIAVALGIDLIHLGLVFVFNIAIGMFTPPFGLNIFIIQSMFKKPLEKIAYAIPPFFVIYLIILLILTYFPQLYMWLPRLAMQ